MKLVTYVFAKHGPGEHVGAVLGDRVLNLRRATGDPSLQTIVSLLAMGAPALDALRATIQAIDAQHSGQPVIAAEVTAPLWAVQLLSPIPEPTSFRDFFGFEQHVAAGYTRRNRPIPPAWYETPVFYFGYHGSFIGPETLVPMPERSSELDFELELACVIGRSARDIAVEDAWTCVAGLTILNDWSARDIQRQEMSVGLGPAKAKDFATSLGPMLITLDEFADVIDGERLSLQMIARINGEEVSRGNSADLHWTIPTMIARASAGVTLRPGDVIATGTVGSGSLFELETPTHPWLQPGDEVELEIERIGRLRNRIAAKA